jgi:acyl carrier protein
MSPRDLLAQITGIPSDALDPDTKLADLALDSIAWVICMMDLERMLGIDLLDAKRGELETVGQVYRLIEAHCSGRVRFVGVGMEN